MFSGVSAENIKKNKLCALCAWWIYISVIYKLCLNTFCRISMHGSLGVHAHILVHSDPIAFPLLGNLPTIEVRFWIFSPWNKVANLLPADVFGIMFYEKGDFFRVRLGGRRQCCYCKSHKASLPEISAVFLVLPLKAVILVPQNTTGEWGSILFKDFPARLVSSP